MKNIYQNNLIFSNDETAINLENAAIFLGISTATVINWVKCGHLKTIDENKYRFFQKKDIEDAKSKILNGSLQKLNKRANKIKAKKTFIPNEYAESANNINQLNVIIDFVRKNEIDLKSAIFFVALNLLKRKNILSKISIKDIVEEKNILIKNKQIKKEIETWLSEINKDKIKYTYNFLLNCNIPKQRDVLGFLYQSLLSEGQKSKNGSYYTPPKLVNDIVDEYVKKDSKVLDPCCGTGQFLLAFSDVIKDPLNIYGIDFDEIAVKIARLNLLIRFKEKNFVPNIFCKNTLLEVDNYNLFDLGNNTSNFDVIATNPPWGVHFSREEIEKLKKVYPTIASTESFSYFLKRSIDLLRNKGIISFILPESILNVKTHRDIRNIILKNTKIKKIVCLNHVFKNVFTSVIRLDVQKSDNGFEDVKIKKDHEEYSVSQSRWLKNRDNVFDVHLSNYDSVIIDKIFAEKHITLKDKADWALGIVTGNNKDYILCNSKIGYEPIFKGKDVQRFVLDEPSSYIKFIPEKFQQVAPITKYRAQEKLIYRFISKYFIFAYDNKKRLTLNSANIVIPKIDGYPIKVIAALFNSSLYQFIFQKKFSSIKILRNHIEQMPLPLWDKEVFSKIVKITNQIIAGENKFNELDDFIMEKYSLSAKEKEYIKGFNK